MTREGPPPPPPPGTRNKLMPDAVAGRVYRAHQAFYDKLVGEILGEVFRFVGSADATELVDTTGDASSNGTAAAGADYTAGSGTLAFAPGASPFREKRIYIPLTSQLTPDFTLIRLRTITI